MQPRALERLGVHIHGVTLTGKVDLTPHWRKQNSDAVCEGACRRLWGNNELRQEKSTPSGYSRRALM